MKLPPNPFTRAQATRHSQLAEELQSHLKLAIADRIAQGQSPEQARQAALRELGNLALIQDVDTELAGNLLLERLARDLRYALRQLRKSPGYALTAILTLALAIGVNTAIFTIVHAILLRELPFREPGRVLSVDSAYTVGLEYHMDAKSLTASFNDVAHTFKTIDAATMYATSGVNAALSGSPTDILSAQRLQATETSAQFLNVLGVTPILGRGFASNEDNPGKDQVVLLSYDLWQSQMHADPAAPGKSILINGKTFTIIGVLPKGVNFPAQASLFTPTIFDEHASLREGGAFFAWVLVRAKTGLSIDAVRAEFASRAAALHPNQSQSNEITKPTLTPIASELTKDIRFSLLMLSVAVSFVLLIACANVASLALVRTAQRRAEFAVRAALGASKSRLIQQQLVESTVIALASGALGILIAYLTLDLIYLLRPIALLEFGRPTIDPTVLAFTALIALATGLLFGIVPAWLAGREDPAGALKSGLWRTTTASARFRKSLIAAEIAIAFVLLTGAGLMLSTMANLGKVNLGFDTANILTFTVSLHGPRYELPPGAKQTSTPNVQAYFTQALERLSALHSVTNAAIVSTLPLDTRDEMIMTLKGDNQAANNQTANHRAPSNDSAESGYAMAAPRVASSGYFAALGIPLLEGRDFNAEDTRTSQPVTIITQEVAQKLWPDQSPIGHQLICSFYCKPSRTVIGVAAPSRRFGPRGDPLAQNFIPYTQQDWGNMTFILRTSNHPSQLIPAARAALRSIDSTQPLYDVSTMQQRLDDNQSLMRFELLTLILFAALSTLLVSIGLYGVIASSVTQRTKEIGIRIALGAERNNILFTFVRESTLIALAGATAGLAASLALTRLLASTLFNVSAHDPATLAAVFFLFTAIALAASAVPAYRAAATNPAQTLRSE